MEVTKSLVTSRGTEVEDTIIMVFWMYTARTVNRFHGIKENSCNKEIKTILV